MKIGARHGRSIANRYDLALRIGEAVSSARDHAKRGRHAGAAGKHAPPGILHREGQIGRGADGHRAEVLAAGGDQDRRIGQDGGALIGPDRPRPGGRTGVAEIVVGDAEGRQVFPRPNQRAARLRLVTDIQIGIDGQAVQVIPDGLPGSQRAAAAGTTGGGGKGVGAATVVIVRIAHQGGSGIIKPNEAVIIMNEHIVQQIKVAGIAAIDVPIQINAGHIDGRPADKGVEPPAAPAPGRG